MFFGTPAWAVPSLRALIDSGTDVAAVVTNPDRAAGRGLQTRYSPVKQAALDAGLEVLQPATARGPELHEALERVVPDVATVVAYGRILPGTLLAIPRLGFVNVHFSLLPAYRGAAPVQRALMAGEKTTGVSIIVLTEGMDEGPVLLNRSEEVRDDDTAASLGARLADLGAEVLVEALDGYATGRITPVEQDHARATYAPKITSDDARIDWDKSGEEIRNLVRGLNPEPGAWTTLRGRRLKVLDGRLSPGAPALSPGEVAEHDGLVAGAADAVLGLERVQLEGKRAMTGGELARGLRLQEGERFD